MRSIKRLINAERVSSTFMVRREVWGQMPDNSDVELFILTNASGAQASVTTYGATLVSLLVPGNRGKLDDVILGYDGLAAYRAGSDYLGATIGRYANRIANGRFTLGGRVHTLSRNEGHNTLHGGLCGFDKKLWQCRPVESNVDTNAIEMMLKSSDGEEGAPGNLTCSDYVHPEPGKRAPRQLSRRFGPRYSRQLH